MINIVPLSCLAKQKFSQPDFVFGVSFLAAFSKFPFYERPGLRQFGPSGDYHGYGGRIW